MILTSIDNSSRYLGLHAGIDKAFAWLKDYELANFKKGEQELDGGILVKFEEPTLQPRENATLEVHRKYIDIHMPLKGTEIIGWAPVQTLKHVREPYNEAKDIAFFGDSAHSLLHVKPGQFAVFFPEDAHAPCIGLGNHRKICIKIPIA